MPLPVHGHGAPIDDPRRGHAHRERIERVQIDGEVEQPAPVADVGLGDRGVHGRLEERDHPGADAGRGPGGQQQHVGAAGRRVLRGDVDRRAEERHRRQGRAGLAVVSGLDVPAHVGLLEIVGGQARLHLVLGEVREPHHPDVVDVRRRIEVVAPEVLGEIVPAHLDVDAAGGLNRRDVQRPLKREIVGVCEADRAAVARVRRGVGVAVARHQEDQDRRFSIHGTRPPSRTRTRRSPRRTWRRSPPSTRRRGPSSASSRARSSSARTRRRPRSRRGRRRSTRPRRAPRGTRGRPHRRCARRTA